jgi:hypothetical protein
MEAPFSTSVRCLFLLHIHLRLLPSLFPEKPKQTRSNAKMMEFNAPTFRVLRPMPERRYPAFVIVESLLCVWSISRWRGSHDLAEVFLRAGFHHLPPDSPSMFRLEE